MSTAVLTSLYRGILHAARSCGLALAKEHAQIAKEHRDVEYIARAHVQRLWAAIAEDADPLLGLRLGLAMDVRHFGPVGVLLCCCADLRSAILALEDFAPMLREPNSVQIGFEGHPLAKVSRSEYPHWHLRSLAAAGAVIRAVSEITGHQVRSPKRVVFACAPEAPVAHYTRLIGCPVTFEDKCHAVLFSEAQGRTELLYANPTLEQRLRRVASQSLRSRSRDTAHVRVRDVLLAAPSLSKEQVAERLGMSLHKLHRLLEEEGMSFMLLSSAVRERHARSALQDSDVTLSEIAMRLGFADESSFSRAFRRWTGMAPGAYRERKRPPRAP